MEIEDGKRQRLVQKVRRRYLGVQTLYNKAYYRLFAFWDKTQATDTLVVSTHGIVKKSQRINKEEIIKALKIKEQYFKEKK
jgi:hypothetical protein